MSDTSHRMGHAMALAGGFVLAEVKKAVRQYFRPLTAAFEPRPSDPTLNAGARVTSRPLAAERASKSAPGR